MKKKKPQILSFIILILTIQNTFSQNNTNKIIQLKLKNSFLSVEVVKTPSKISKGLMFRDTLQMNSGMLFIFKKNTRRCMWMKNTKIPLSVAFLNSSGMIINIEDMDPFTQIPHCSIKNAKFALEVNRGWFKRKNIEKNTLVKGLPNVE